MNIMPFHRNGAEGAPAEVSGPDAGVAGASAPTDRRVPTLAYYLSVARRRKWIILGAILASLLLGLAATLAMTPLYTATATLEIQRESGNFTNVKGADSSESRGVDLEFYQTQYGLLRARSLADRVATELRLFDNAEFFEMFGSPKTDDWFAEGRVKPQASTREQRIREAGEILLDNFEVEPARLSRLVDVSFTSPDRQLSKRVVDAWGAHFVQGTLERRFEATSYARRFLEDRLAQLRERIEASERLLVTYAARNGIVNLPATTPGTEGGMSGERSLVAEDLAVLNRELSRATTDRVKAESRLRGDDGAVAEALQNTAISGLRERRAELASDYAKMMVQFEPNYPPARELQTQIAQLDRSIGREEARVRNSLREAYLGELQREQNLRNQVNQLKTGLLDLRRRSIQYNIHEREVDTNRQLYDALLQRYKEIGVAGGVGVNNIAVVDPAEVPVLPSSPKLFLNMVLALLAGCLIGIGGALALEQIDEGIADPAELESMLNVPLLGTIPTADHEDPMAALEDRKSSLSEAYLSLQTNLAFSTDHGVPRTVAITSSQSAEGKTTTSYALARLLARTKRRTLLIDADMRSPSIHRAVGAQNQQGLSNYLSGDDDWQKLVVPTSSDGLFVICAGPQPPSAAELLSGDRLDRLLVELKGQFDHVIIDAPPVMGLADAPLIGSKVEGTVFVIESHRVKKGMARVAVQRMRAASGHVLGAVLTKFDSRRAHFGYGYDYGYGYGYGERENRGAAA